MRNLIEVVLKKIPAYIAVLFFSFVSLSKVFAEPLSIEVYNASNPSANLNSLNLGQTIAGAAKYYILILTNRAGADEHITAFNFPYNSNSFSFNNANGDWPGTVEGTGLSAPPGIYRCPNYVWPYSDALVKGYKTGNTITPIKCYTVLKYAPTAKVNYLSKIEFNYYFQPTAGGNRVNTSTSIPVTGTVILPADLRLLSGGLDVPSTVNFGERINGQILGEYEIQFKNLGDVPTKPSFPLPDVAAIKPFVMTYNTCTSNLGLNGTCSIKLQFRPNATDGATVLGQNSKIFKLTYLNGLNPVAIPKTVTLTGTVVTSSLLSISSPRGYNFEPQVKDTDSTEAVFQITNFRSLATLPRISIVSADGTASPSPFTATPCLTPDGLNLARGLNESCKVKVKFRPSAYGTASKSLQVIYPDGFGSHETKILVPLSGQGIAKAKLAFFNLDGSAFTGYNFGTIGAETTSTELSILVKNIGEVPNQPAFTPPSPQLSIPLPFEITSNACATAMLAKGGNPCLIKVRYSPTQDTITNPNPSQPVTARYIESKNGGLFTASVISASSLFSGSALNLVVGSVNFGSVKVNTTTPYSSFADRVLQLTNNGNDTVALQWPAWGTSLSEVSNSCGTSLSVATKTCQVTLRYTPTAAGSFSPSLNLMAANKSIPLSISGFGTQPQVSYEITDFLGQPIGQKKLGEITITNAGNQVLHVTGGTLVNTSGQAFNFRIPPATQLGTFPGDSGTCTSSTVLAVNVNSQNPPPVASQCKVNLEYLPSDFVNYSATFALQTQEQDFTRVVSGTSVGASNLTIATVGDQPSAYLGSSANFEFRITNNGNLSGYIGASGPALSAPFSYSPNASTAFPGQGVGVACAPNTQLIPGGSCSIYLKFSPGTTRGPSPLTYTVNVVNQVVENQVIQNQTTPLTVSTTGFGMKAADIAPLTSLNFGNVLPGQIKNLTVTLKNQGDGPGILTSVGLPIAISSPAFSYLRFKPAPHSDSGVFPGHGGTCQSQTPMESEDTCTVNLQFLAGDMGSLYTSIQIVTGTTSVGHILTGAVLSPLPAPMLSYVAPSCILASPTGNTNITVFGQNLYSSTNSLVGFFSTQSNDPLLSGTSTIYDNLSSGYATYVPNPNGKSAVFSLTKLSLDYLANNNRNYIQYTYQFDPTRPHITRLGESELLIGVGSLADGSRYTLPIRIGRTLNLSSITRWDENDSTGKVIHKFRITGNGLPPKATVAFNNGKSVTLSPELGGSTATGIFPSPMPIGHVQVTVYGDCGQVDNSLSMDIASSVASSGSTGGQNTSVVSSSTSLACLVHPGAPYPWEGSGACTGNFMTNIPLSTLSVSLIHNSVSPSGYYGFGLGFRLSIDRRAIPSGSGYVMESGDGQRITYSNQDAAFGGFIADNRTLSRSVLSVSTNGQVLTEKTPYGSTLTYSAKDFNGNFVLTQMTALNGQSLRIERNSLGNISSIQDPSGMAILFNYDRDIPSPIADNALPLVSYITDKAGQSYRFSYRASTGAAPFPTNALLEGITLPSDSRISLNYASLSENGLSNVVTSIVNPAGDETKIAYYDNSPFLYSITDELGNVVAYQQILNAQSGSSVETLSFRDKLVENFSSGKMISRKNNGLTESFGYDSQGAVTSYTDPYGISTTISYANDSGNYNPWHLITSTHRLNTTTTIARTYNQIAVPPSLQSLTATISANGHSIQKNITYGQFELPTSEQVPGQPLFSKSYQDGQLTSLSINSNVLYSASFHPKSTSNANDPLAGTMIDATVLGRSYSFDYYANGLLASQAGPLSSMSYSYDASGAGNGAPTTISGTGTNLATSYDANGNISSSTQYGNQNKVLRYSALRTANTSDVTDERMVRTWQSWGGGRSLEAVSSPYGYSNASGEYSKATVTKEYALPPPQTTISQGTVLEMSSRARSGN